jgi:transcriptional repressor NrdR
LEPYDRRKLLTSIRVAAAKRPVTDSEVDAIVEEIEGILDHSDTTEIESRQLGEMVMERLKTRDHIAYVRFASVYRNFQDLTEFFDELRELDERSMPAELRRYQEELPLGSSASNDSDVAPKAAPTAAARKAAGSTHNVNQA